MGYDGEMGEYVKRYKGGERWDPADWQWKPRGARKPEPKFPEENLDSEENIGILKANKKEDPNSTGPAHNASNLAKLKEHLRTEELKSNGFFKQGGGRSKTDFINEHSFNRYQNNLGVASNQNRTQFDPNIDVAKLRYDTIANADSIKIDPRSGATVYTKKYDFDISAPISDGRGLSTPATKPSRVHKVIIHPDPTKSTQFPLAPRHEVGQ